MEVGITPGEVDGSTCGLVAMGYSAFTPEAANMVVAAASMLLKSAVAFDASLSTAQAGLVPYCTISEESFQLTWKKSGLSLCSGNSCWERVAVIVREPFRDTFVWCQSMEQLGQGEGMHNKQLTRKLGIWEMLRRARRARAVRYITPGEYLVGFRIHENRILKSDISWPLEFK